MNTHGPSRRRLGTIGVLIVSSWMLAAGAQAGGTGSFGSARLGGAGNYSGSFGGGFGGLSRGSSVINHGGTGFSVYSQQGVTRVIGMPQVSRTILLPNGRSSRVIGDGKGGAHVFGAQGNHRIFGNRRLFGNDGP
jgi:hypothetical protein